MQPRHRPPGPRARRRRARLSGRAPRRPCCGRGHHDGGGVRSWALLRPPLAPDGCRRSSVGPPSAWSREGPRPRVHPRQGLPQSGRGLRPGRSSPRQCPRRRAGGRPRASGGFGHRASRADGAYVQSRRRWEMLRQAMRRVPALGVPGSSARRPSPPEWSRRSLVSPLLVTRSRVAVRVARSASSGSSRAPSRSIH